MSLRKLLRWDEDSRQAAYADYYDELERCDRCGNLREVCMDAETVWYPQRVICYATMEREGAARTYERIHEARPYHNGKFTSWSKTASRAHPYHFMDGVRIGVWLEDFQPDDDFLADTSGLMNPGGGGFGDKA